MERRSAALRTAALRVGAAAAVAGLVAAAGPGWAAGALTPPAVDPGPVPADTTPGPDQPLRFLGGCAVTGVLPGTDLGAPPVSQAFMNLPALWQSAGRGGGQTVALIDTGVTPSPRLPHLRGAGDYVAPGDGLSDCDAHGSLVASIIGGAPAETDGFVGVAPDAALVSIRQSSNAFTPESPGPGDPETDRRAGTVATLARAIVHAANAGARVINMSVVACIPVLKPVDQTALGAAVRYAAVNKDAVLVAAAGNLGGQDSCAQNPDVDATNTKDPRNWGGVVTISTPSWFSDYVLSVSATDGSGQPAVDQNGREMSLSGPWVGVAAPGVFVAGFNGPGFVNAALDSQSNELKSFSGTSFSAAYISGLAALVRAKYPNLSAAQVIRRIEYTAHSPAHVVDNRMGYGVVDGAAALNDDVPVGDRLPTAENLSRPLALAPPAPAPDRRPLWTAVIGSASLIVVVGLLFGVRRLIGAGRRSGPNPNGRA